MKSNALSSVADYGASEAKNFECCRNGPLDSAEEIVQLLNAFASKTDSPSLEIGCGPGFYSRRVHGHRKGFSGHVGADRSISMLGRARRTSRECSCLTWCVADGEHLPFANEVFYFSYAIKMVHQILDRRRLFHEVDRVLVPGGTFVVVTPSHDRLREFPLFSANLGLAEQQLASLPRREILLHEAHGTRLKFLGAERIRGSGSVSPQELQRLIRLRFLSILLGLSSETLQAVERSTAAYLNRFGCKEVQPYWQETYIFVKEHPNEV